MSIYRYKSSYTVSGNLVSRFIDRIPFSIFIPIIFMILF
nr:MAG TPA: hypothetical protein [Caudoviricetes sp.]DAK71349.1 MAG TPA: hypothetical protein [Caudoviricetes sp.]DAP68984.1 MAG TPA: hypothetical protein [Caudoviricetes sp.]DAZ38228.1 MAG TPA: hypothetical protein [Caudoviricetes sp.]